MIKTTQTIKNQTITQKPFRHSSQFSLSELKKTIPTELFESSLLKSIFYFGVDVFVISGLFYLAATLDSPFFYPLYWFLQGTFFWALFVVGHDCGHGSFSKYKWINSLFGHLAHTPLLVPYHGWRISHRTHHNNTGNMDKDESWYPLSESDYKNLPWSSYVLRYKLFLLVFPLYLFVRSPNRDGSHFLPSSDLFSPSEKWQVLTSTALWIMMISLLGYLGYTFGFVKLLNLYILPYFVFVVWLSLVTFLHHTDTNLPWYRSSNWNFVKGALSTIDRSYGIFEPIHHNIGTHVVHHIFSKIPHYNLVKANQHLKEALGEHYLSSNESIWKAYVRAYQTCHYVSDEGDTVYYIRDK
ncbi:MAG TPA: fatty acid desaturase [Leptospiraceae bacterium]|nr:fatty acid desaturase [Leptospiraceae bacterium]HMW06664.1 fatty acid desaturase [Leptospiraceae bacterium]HMX34654.1 fatty acid desaturase [Leptospiraceae bacterium]HMY33715.1 fatty acid desaturase [Leptospiraceae bacterium]HMZ66190.1 fatty acid desaturase [Leptospiraceae bacterium]